MESQPARQKLIEYYDSTKTIPSSLSVAGVDETLPDGVGLSLDPSGMILTVKSKRGALVVTPMRDKEGKINWGCSAGEGVKQQQLPRVCRLQ